MKAESAVFTGVQQPLSLFGLSPQLFALNIGGAALVFGIFIALDLMALALIGAIVSFLIAWCFLFRATRRDPHFANFIFVTPRFWQGRSCRRLIAGDSKRKRDG